MENCGVLWKKHLGNITNLECIFLTLNIKLYFRSENSLNLMLQHPTGPSSSSCRGEERATKTILHNLDQWEQAKQVLLKNETIQSLQTIYFKPFSSAEGGLKVIWMDGQTNNRSIVVYCNRRRRNKLEQSPRKMLHCIRYNVY